MCLLSDRDIEFYAMNRDMIEPFVSESINVTKDGARCPSFGLSSYGYDIRLANEYVIFTGREDAVIDMRELKFENFTINHVGQYCDIPPNGFVLARSYEYFQMPPNVEGLVYSKSTYARCGNFCLATPLEPAWCGHITLEFANLSPVTQRIYSGDGCAQVLFLEGKSQCRTTYADRHGNGGKYQNQTGVTLAKV